MHIGRNEDDVPDGLVPDELQQVGDFQLAAERRAIVGIGNRLVAVLVGDDEAQRHIAGNDFPRRRGRSQLRLQPASCTCAEDCRIGVDNSVCRFCEFGPR